jgi:hypothetical protein
MLCLCNRMLTLYMQEVPVSYQGFPYSIEVICFILKTESSKFVLFNNLNMLKLFFPSLPICSPLTSVEHKIIVYVTPFHFVIFLFPFFPDVHLTLSDFQLIFFHSVSGFWFMLRCHSARFYTIT